MKSRYQKTIPIALRYILVGVALLMSLGLASAADSNVIAYNVGDIYTLSNGMINYTFDCTDLIASEFMYWNDTSSAWSKDYTVFYRTTAAVSKAATCIWQENTTTSATINRTNYVNHTHLITIEKGLPYVQFDIDLSIDSAIEEIAWEIPTDAANWQMIHFGCNGTSTQIDSTFNYVSHNTCVEDNISYMWNTVENITFFSAVSSRVTGNAALKAAGDGTYLYPMQYNNPQDFESHNNTYFWGAFAGFPTSSTYTYTNTTHLNDSFGGGLGNWTTDGTWAGSVRLNLDDTEQAHNVTTDLSACTRIWLDFLVYDTSTEAGDDLEVHYYLGNGTDILIDTILWNDAQTGLWRHKLYEIGQQGYNAGAYVGFNASCDSATDDWYLDDIAYTCDITAISYIYDDDSDSIPDVIDNDTADYSPYYNYYEPYSYATNCSDHRDLIFQEALNLLTYDEGSDTDLIITDVEIGFTPLYANGTDIRDIGVDSNNLTTHEYCIFPKYTRILYDAHIQTATDDYYPRDYFFTNSSIKYPDITLLNLYLVNETQGDQIAVHVRDENLNDREGAEVRILRWLPPAYTTVSIINTNSEGKAYVAVDRDEWYKFQVLEGGTLYHTTEPTQLLGKDTTTYPYVIDVTFGDPLGYFEWLDGITYTATWSSTTNVYTFIVADTTGDMTSGSVSADQMNLTGQARVCWQNSTSASFTISCDLSGEYNGTYNLNAWFEVSDEKFIVDSRIVSKGAATTQLTNQDGLVMSFIFIGTVGMAGIIHPVLMILLTIFGLIAVGVLQLSLIGLEYILPIVFVGILLIFIMRRK